MDDLIETLEAIAEEGSWALAAEWSPEKLKAHLGSMTAQARYAAELAKDWALIKEVENG